VRAQAGPVLLTGRDLARTVGGRPDRQHVHSADDEFQTTSWEYFILRMPEIMVDVKKTAIRPHFAWIVSALATAFCRPRSSAS